MSTVLITGASGFIGRALAVSMAEHHEVICLGRENPQIEAVRYLRGDFTHFEDLRQLDRPKYMMEEMTRYHFRQHPDIDVMNLRLSSVIPDDEKAAPRGMRALGQWALGGITVMVLPDAVRAFTIAAESPFVPGLRIMNATASRAWASVPTADILSEWWGNDVDLSWFESPSRRNASVYDVEKIRTELGFTAERTLEILEERG